MWGRAELWKYGLLNNKIIRNDESIDRPEGDRFLILTHAYQGSDITGEGGRIDIAG